MWYISWWQKPTIQPKRKNTNPQNLYPNRWFFIHPPKQTWNLKMDPWKRRFLPSFPGSMLSFGGVNLKYESHCAWQIQTKNQGLDSTTWKQFQPGKICASRQLGSFPQGFGVKIPKKYLSCHHLDDYLAILQVPWTLWRLSEKYHRKSFLAIPKNRSSK